MHERLVESVGSVLDIGAGPDPVSNKADTLDHVASFDPDYVHDLSELPLSIEDNEYELVVLRDVL